MKANSLFSFSKVHVISRTEGPDKRPYMIRYSLIETPWFGIKLHVFLRSDDDCLHDHPWGFMSFILAGEYIEVTDAGQNLRKRFSLAFRRAEHRHRVVLVDGLQPVVTFLINGPRRREWGFWTPKGWVQWFKYGGGKCLIP